MIYLTFDLYASLRYKSNLMGVPRQLTERQMKFAELLIYNEGRMSPAECALQAGYKTRPRQAASELRNPKISPLVVKYIGELRAEVQEKHGITFERHLGELAKLRDEATAKGAWSAAINAEVARGKAGGLYVDQKMIMTGNLDNLSIDDLKDSSATGAIKSSQVKFVHLRSIQNLILPFLDFVFTANNNYYGFDFFMCYM